MKLSKFNLDMSVYKTLASSAKAGVVLSMYTDHIENMVEYKVHSNVDGTFRYYTLDQAVEKYNEYYDV